MIGHPMIPFVSLVRGSKILSLRSKTPWDTQEIRIRMYPARRVHGPVRGALATGRATRFFSHSHSSRHIQSWHPVGQGYPGCRGPSRHAARPSDISETPGPGGSQSPSMGTPPQLRGKLAALADAISSYFPLVVAASALLGALRPAALTWVPASWMSPFLGLSMLGMGLTLSFSDFRRVLAAPRNILLGVLLQYSVMPSLAFGISRLLALPLDLTIGLCIVGACPGGTASNIVTYLAKADVPLSVAMTTASTLGAVVMTPLLTSLLLGTLVRVDAMGLLLSTVQVVLLPVALGTALNQAFPEAVARLSPLSTLSAVLLVAFICGRVMAESSGLSLQTALGNPAMLLGIFCLHAGGFLLGYVLSKFVVGMEERAARTNSIEVGMQNSALGAMLATQHFGAMHPLAAVPCAISAVMHSCMGSLLAAYWGRRGSSGSNE